MKKTNIREERLVSSELQKEPYNTKELTKSKRTPELFTGRRLAQLYKLTKQLDLREHTGVEIPTKHLLLLSVQIHQKMHAGTIIQIFLMDFSNLLELQLV